MTEKNHFDGLLVVTGATGLLGSHLIALLLKKQYPVRALRRENANMMPLKKVLALYFDEPEKVFEKIEWKEADLLDPDPLKQSLTGATHLFHCAGFVSFSPADKEIMKRINVEGVINLMYAAQQCGIKWVGHVSSIAACGSTENGELINEKTPWLSQIRHSAYAWSKYKGEREVWRTMEEGLPVAIVAPAVIIGPGNWDNGSPAMIKRMWDGLSFYTKGINGFVDVRDVALALLMLFEKNISEKKYILCAQNLSYKDFFSKVAIALNKKPPKYYAGKFLSGIAWRAEKIRTLFNGKKPLITRETAHTATSVSRYDGTLICKETGFTYLSFDETIQYTCKAFLQDHLFS